MGDGFSQAGAHVDALGRWRRVHQTIFAGLDVRSALSYDGFSKEHLTRGKCADTPRDPWSSTKYPTVGGNVRSSSTVVNSFTWIVSSERIALIACKR